MATQDVATKLKALEQAQFADESISAGGGAVWRPNPGDVFVGVYVSSETSESIKRKVHHFVVRAGDVTIERQVYGQRQLNKMLETLGTNTPVRVVFHGKNNWGVHLLAKK